MRCNCGMHVSGLPAFAFKQRSYCSISPLQRSFIAFTSPECLAAQAVSASFRGAQSFCQVFGFESTQIWYASTSFVQCIATCSSADCIAIGSQGSDRFSWPRVGCSTRDLVNADCAFRLALTPPKTSNFNTCSSTCSPARHSPTFPLTRAHLGT